MIPPGGMDRQPSAAPRRSRSVGARVDWRPMDPSTPFAHASEAEMARILDFYAVRWEYEPETFPILWNLDGEVVESFSPDFYLPELDLYLEMTTLRQRLVRKKNRKLRRLRELYPAINIKLFYARDFRALMLKYGKLALVDGLSGLAGPGQVPARRAVAAPVELRPPTSRRSRRPSRSSSPSRPGAADRRRRPVDRPAPRRTRRDPSPARQPRPTSTRPSAR